MADDRGRFRFVTLRCCQALRFAASFSENHSMIRRYRSRPIVDAGSQCSVAGAMPMERVTIQASLNDVLLRRAMM